MKQTLFLLLTIAMLASCKSDNSTASNTGTASTDNGFETAKSAYETTPDRTTASAYLAEIIKKVSEKKDDKASVIALATTGYDVAKEQNISSRARGFLFTLLKEDGGHADTPKRVLDLANEMAGAKRPEMANIFYKSLIENYPNSEFAKEAQAKIDPAVSNLDTYILNIGENIFKGDVNKIGINRNAALKYVDACEAFGLVFPKAEKTPSYLFRAAEIAKSINTFPKVLSLYDWIIDRYPNYEKTPTTYFLKGFVLENDLQNDEKAKEVYEAFIKKYPNHELRDDVDFLLEHLGKSDDEIRKIIESKQQENES